MIDTQAVNRAYVSKIRKGLFRIRRSWCGMYPGRSSQDWLASDGCVIYETMDESQSALVIALIFPFVLRDNIRNFLDRLRSYEMLIDGVSRKEPRSKKQITEIRKSFCVDEHHENVPIAEASINRIFWSIMKPQCPTCTIVSSFIKNE